MTSLPLQPPVSLRVVLADLKGSARDALAALLRGLEGVTVTGEVDARDEVAATLRATDADVLVIDDRLLAPAPGPLPAAPRVIVVGVDDDPAFAARALRLGAEAWVAKDRADDDLPALLRAS